jgi:hypothetical protein
MDGDEDGFGLSRMHAELSQAMHCFRGDEPMEAFEARAAAVRALVHEEIMRARVWFMNVKEGGD